MGISHGPAHERLGVKPGKALEDMRRFVQDLKAGAKQVGELPPITLATLRKKMTALSAEIAQGAVWANASRSHMPESLKALPDTARTGPDFFIGNMVPTCIDTDRAAAAAVNRRTLTGYVKLPNYQNYWIEAGFEDEMQAIRKAIAAGQEDTIPSLMSDRWLSQVTLYGSPTEVRDGVEAWYAAGVKTLIMVPSSAKGNQMAALQELIDSTAEAITEDHALFHLQLGRVTRSGAATLGKRRPQRPAGTRCCTVGRGRIKNHFSSAIARPGERRRRRRPV